jgi:hypothetical protein
MLFKAEKSNTPINVKFAEKIVATLSLIIGMDMIKNIG